jgi:two-component system, NarL family, sensor histidine kinase UhpB
MTLRMRMQLLVGVLTLVFLFALGATQLTSARESIKEEVASANRVAVQLLQRTGWVYAAQGTPAMVAYLQGLGRVRSNDIVLTDKAGVELYRSPESPYKAGRHAPAWFASLLEPDFGQQVVAFPDGKLEIRANASRAVLDAWDSLWGAGLPLVAAMLVLHGLVYAWARRIVQPFGQITQGLEELKAGNFQASLPPLKGREAATIGEAFNRMVQVLGEHIETEKRAVLAERQLDDQRALSRWVDHRLDEERRAIARELHDELGQSVTAMRSVATSLAHRAGESDPDTRNAALLIADECKRLYDAMHGIIPRLAPLVLDNLGLQDALQDLRERLLRSHPGLNVQLEITLPDSPLSHQAALTLYRAAQEGASNALRHGQASTLNLKVVPQAQGVRLQLDDDGQGLKAADTRTPDPQGHYGLVWLKERCAALSGHAELTAREPGPGCSLRVWLPLMSD